MVALLAVQLQRLLLQVVAVNLLQTGVLVQAETGGGRLGRGERRGRRNFIRGVSGLLHSATKLTALGGVGCQACCCSCFELGHAVHGRQRLAVLSH